MSEALEKIADIIIKEDLKESEKRHFIPIRLRLVKIKIKKVGFSE